MKKYTAEYLKACFVHNYQDRKTIYPESVYERFMREWKEFTKLIHKHEGKTEEEE